MQLLLLRVLPAMWAIIAQNVCTDAGKRQRQAKAGTGRQSKVGSPRDLDWVREAALVSYSYKARTSELVCMIYGDSRSRRRPAPSSLE